MKIRAVGHIHDFWYKVYFIACIPLLRQFLTNGMMQDPTKISQNCSASKLKRELVSVETLWYNSQCSMF